ncbi:hypothetical protein BJ875DRAFT_373125 [Amylocarpus encephaloides]|uniref:Uncharacterized protein n=1 Tax=Amylocarpus encephaloides TaxID=45428 RepID=A0A9P7YMW5_9HELO|nr:hypothetical protein BJ875DRAFT_373125 [Amylocarpus encephaloides]
MSTTVIPQKPPLLSPITIETVLKSRRKSPTSVNREFALPSPTIAAAHAYYLESQVAEISGSSIATRSIDSLETQRPQGSPPASPGTLVSHLETFTLTPNPREKQLTHSTHTPRRQSASILDVPFLFIHNHLRDWGNVYLFNTASADAFVNAISLRRSSVPVGTAADPTIASSETVIRARLGQGPTPIHVEYALHFLPVLATLLLSSHVRKGDMIDLAVPHPEIWKDVVTWVYTGRPTVTKGMEEVIRYLGGAVD